MIGQMGLDKLDYSSATQQQAKPSRFEPCGLNQLYAMGYGTLPVVHSTGGLRDTVTDFNPYAQEGKGEVSGHILKLAIGTYTEHKSYWLGLMKRGNGRDSTWENAAIQYKQSFRLVLYASSICLSWRRKANGYVNGCGMFVILSELEKSSWSPGHVAYTHRPISLCTQLIGFIT
ncbi:Pentafunctional AROM polypeptide [Datura stramonium]|uniref:Pentafunctional AROM polypeptide n=1 Tax=Datura stramonium TaxID=4076 RepID=A0ABS8SGN1_DATST|nr:Pentafunctional AROM polypeptide [Datura stramonium]